MRVKEKITKVVLECSEKNGIVFTIRSETNITKMRNIGNSSNSKLVDNQIMPLNELRNFQKILNNL